MFLNKHQNKLFFIFATAIIAAIFVASIVPANAAKKVSHRVITITGYIEYHSYHTIISQHVAKQENEGYVLTAINETSGTPLTLVFVRVQ